MESLNLAQVLSSPYQLLTMPLLSSPTLAKKSSPAKRGSVRTALRTSRSVSRYNPAQSPPEIAPDNSEKVNQSLLLSDPSQSPPEIAQERSSSDQLPWQSTTSRRSVRASCDDVIAPLFIDVCNDVMLNSPPASAVCPSSTVTSSVLAVDSNSSVELPTSVVDSTSVLSTPSSDVNPTSVC